MSVVGVGLDLLAEAVSSQAADVTRVDWRPPMPGTESDLATVALDTVRADANALALERMLAVQARLVDVVPAREALGLETGQFLHAGPPITWPGGGLGEPRQPRGASGPPTRATPRAAGSR